MQPPLKNKVILGLDPAYRTGCKIAVIDQNGTVLDTTVVYPTPPQNKIEEAEIKLKHYIEKAFTIILASTIVIWFLSSFTFNYLLDISALQGRKERRSDRIL